MSNLLCGLLRLLPGSKFRLWLKMTGLGCTLLFSVASSFAVADDEAVGRSRAANIAQSAFGGKVLSVDEQEETAVDPEADETTQPNQARYIVKLLQNGGRIKVIKLDAAGKIL